MEEDLAESRRIDTIVILEEGVDQTVHLSAAFIIIINSRKTKKRKREFKKVLKEVQ